LPREMYFEGWYPLFYFIIKTWFDNYFYCNYNRNKI
jgi:hypothetical protein